MESSSILAVKNLDFASLSDLHKPTDLFNDLNLSDQEWL